jgi:spermidine/putrescine transport system ATP-binding protein
VTPFSSVKILHGLVKGLGMTERGAGSLILENVTRIFWSGEREAGVRDVSFTVPQGTGFSLLGPSGCGKTTTLRVIGGFETADSGRVIHNDQDITKVPPQDRDIRTVFQKYALFPHLSVFENIAFGLRMQGLPSAEVKKRVQETAELIEVAPLLARSIGQLSGGEQQRVALARAIVTEPEVLLLDEPLSALDLKLREKMQLELLSLRYKLGSTFVFVTHDQAEAMALSDKVAVMNRGHIEQIGTPEAIYHRPKTRFVASFIGQANFLNAEQAQLLKGSVDQMPNIDKKKEWLVRPEHFTPRKIGDEIPTGFVGMECTVLENAFTGSDRISKVKDKSGRSILIKTQGFEPPAGKVREKILLTWEVEDTWTVDSEVVS